MNTQKNSIALCSWSPQNLCLLAYFSARAICLYSSTAYMVGFPGWLEKSLPFLPTSTSALWTEFLSNMACLGSMEEAEMQHFTPWRVKSGDRDVTCVCGEWVIHWEVFFNNVSWKEVNYIFTGNITLTRNGLVITIMRNDSIVIHLLSFIKSYSF